MTEVQTFYGDWLVQCDQVNAGFSQRFSISGSENSDGVHPGTPGNQIRVSGQEWFIKMEWNDGAGSDWPASDIRRSASYTISDGLVVTLGADDNLPSLRDLDYDDMIIVCKSLNPNINPQPSSFAFDFTISKDMIKEKEPCQKTLFQTP